MCGRSLTFRGLLKRYGAPPLLECSHRKSSASPGHSPEKTSSQPEGQRPSAHRAAEPRDTAAGEFKVSENFILSSRACAVSRHAFSSPPRTFLESSGLRPGNRSCCRRHESSPYSSDACGRRHPFL